MKKDNLNLDEFLNENPQDEKEKPEPTPEKNIPLLKKISEAPPPFLPLMPPIQMILLKSAE